jgi:uncharacterized cupredoxin-like copper-binding protein
VLIYGLSSGNKLAIAVMAAIFAGFSLIAAMLIPRWRPQFPGRGVPTFVGLCVLLFAGMMSVVIVFARESKSEAAGKPETSSVAETTTAASTTTSAASTTAGATTTSATQKVTVTESEWKVSLPETTLKAGKYEFEVQNDGKFPHDLTIKGPGVSAATPQFNSGQTQTLTVDLKPGSYDFYCSIPGHKQAGMDQKVTVS